MQTPKLTSDATSIPLTRSSFKSGRNPWPSRIGPYELDDPLVARQISTPYEDKEKNKKKATSKSNRNLGPKRESFPDPGNGKPSQTIKETRK